MDIEKLKKKAALKALEYVKPGMNIGLGCDSTSTYALYALADGIKEGKYQGVKVIPCSRQYFHRAQKLGIPVTRFREIKRLHLCIDSADEIDINFNMIKGLEGSLIMERVVNHEAEMNITIVDMTKLSPKLGSLVHLPLEIVPMALRTNARFIEKLGGYYYLKIGYEDKPFITDCLNLILECWWEENIENPYQFAEYFSKRPGLVDHGLFLDSTDLLIIGRERSVKIMEKGNFKRYEFLRMANDNLEKRTRS